MRLVKKTIGANIARLREKAGLKQAQFAEKMGVEVPTVSRWENGHLMPDDKKIDAMLEIFKATEEDLLRRAPESPEDAAMNLLKEASAIARSQTSDFTSEELELIRAFRALPPKRKNVATVLLRDLADLDTDALLAEVNRKAR